MTNIHPEVSNHIPHFYVRRFLLRKRSGRPEFMGFVFYSGYQIFLMKRREITQGHIFQLCYTQFQIQWSGD